MKLKKPAARVKPPPHPPPVASHPYAQPHHVVRGFVQSKAVRVTSGQRGVMFLKPGSANRGGGVDWRVRPMAFTPGARTLRPQETLAAMLCSDSPRDPSHIREGSVHWRLTQPKVHSLVWMLETRGEVGTAVRRGNTAHPLQPHAVNSTLAFSRGFTVSSKKLQQLMTNKITSLCLIIHQNACWMPIPPPSLQEWRFLATHGQY